MATDDPVGLLLLAIEATDLSRRVAPRGLQLWAVDCARRAFGFAPRRLLEPGTLRRGLRVTAAVVREQMPKAELEPVVRELERAHASAIAAYDAQVAERARPRLLDPLRRAVNAAAAVETAARHVHDGSIELDHVASLARQAFVEPAVEGQAQARRLLMRSGLLRSSDELLVRLDYAESRGLLDTPTATQARQRLMAGDAETRFSVALRYLDAVFHPELD